MTEDQVKTSRTITAADLSNIRRAGELMKEARDLLRRAQAGNAARYVARALKSVEGAERHAYGHASRSSVPAPAAHSGETEGL
jgi:hypothetical protein